MSRNEDEFRTVQSGKAIISYQVLSDREKPMGTICLLASTGRGPEDFQHLAKLLVKGGLRVILPWPRGTGISTGDYQDITFQDLAADVAATLIKEKRESPVILAGHAFGCWIARTLAAERPELVDALIFMAAAAERWPPKLSQAINIAMAFDATKQDRLAALRLAFFAANSNPDVWLNGWYPELALLQRNARKLTNRASWWSSGQAPILDIVGTDDPFRPPEELDFYQREFGKRVERRLVKDASHALPDEKPLETAANILDWVKHLPKN